MAEKEKCQTCASKDVCKIDEEALLKPTLSRIKHKIIIMSGKGGVGKSTVAACLAIALAQKGHKVGLLDIDLHGPSIPHLLAIKDLIEITEQKIIPKKLMPNLEVVSIECFMSDETKDQAVIWRGPLKHSAIRQFLADVEWGELDCLIIDSPPGTGDEPLSIAHLIPDAKAIIVATPQELALADVRKSISFCKHVQMDIIGLVENMSGFICPHCGKQVDIFKSGGGKQTAELTRIPFLGKLPVDLSVVEAGDEGKLLEYMQNKDNPYAKAFDDIAQNVLEQLKQTEVKPVSLAEIRARKEFKVAIPIKDGKRADFLTECDQLAMIHVRNGKIRKVEKLVPAEKDTAVVPMALVRLGADLVITKCMKEKAKHIFHKNGIGVLLDVPELSPEELVEKFIAGELGGE